MTQWLQQLPRPAQQAAPFALPALGLWLGYRQAGIVGALLGGFAGAALTGWFIVRSFNYRRH